MVTKEFVLRKDAKRLMKKMFNIKENVFEYKKYLYEDKVSLYLYFDFEENRVSYNVCNSETETIYHPFYNDYGNNRVRDIVIENFNKETDGFIKKGIMREKGKRKHGNKN